MAFPAVVTTNKSATPTASTSHIVGLPASLVSGNLILILLDKGTPAATASFNTLAGWTELLDEAVPSGMAVWYRVSTGAEGATVTFTSTAAIRDATITYQISGALDPTTQAPQLSTLATGTNATPNATTCTPTGGAKDYLWITFFGQTGEQLDDNSLTTVTPTGFSNPIEKTCGTAGTNLGGMIASAQQQLNAASLDAAAWTSSDATAWRAFTIAIHPAPPSLKQGSASGTIAWVGSATGIQSTDPNQGEGVGSITWAGTVTGTNVRSGSAPGTISWAGSATGTNVRSGSVSGTIVWAGSAAGDATYRWISLPGAAGNYLQTPDSAELDITGDLCIVARLAANNWSAGAYQAIVSKRDSTSTQSYRFFVEPTGKLTLIISPTGVDQILINSTVVLPTTDGAWTWVAVTLDVDNGAGGRETRFWTSDNGTTWEPLGTTVPGAATSIHPSTSVLQIGGASAITTQNFAGLIQYVSIRNGIDATGAVGGTEVFRLDTEADLATTSPSATSFIATTGQTITIHRSGDPQTELVTFNPPQGAATGAITWTGTTTGTSIRQGAVTGTIGWVGTATGTAPNRGAATGAITWASAGTGTSVHSGAVSGAISWAGVTTGTRTMKGAATGAITWAGTATGEAPTAGLQEGSAFGDILWSGTTTGVSAHQGSVTGTSSWVGAATGINARSGATAGSITWTGTATGTATIVVLVVALPSVFRRWRVQADDRTLAPVHDRRIIVAATDRLAVETSDRLVTAPSGTRTIPGDIP